MRVCVCDGCDEQVSAFKITALCLCLDGVCRFAHRILPLSPPEKRRCPALGAIDQPTSALVTPQASAHRLRTRPLTQTHLRNLLRMQAQAWRCSSLTKLENLCAGRSS